MLTARILEEKAKWVDVMNEANSVFEGARMNPALGGSVIVNQEGGQSLNTRLQPEDDLS
jgi:hypothetical protein